MPSPSRTAAVKRLLEHYDYDLPRGQIALRPAQPRDSAKVLTYNRRTGTVQSDRFFHLGKYIPAHAVLVLNDTKVIPARLQVVKPSGGKAELLYLGHSGSTFTALSDRRLEIGWELKIGPRVRLTVVRHTGSVYRFRPSGSITTFLRLLEHHGTTPLPPYLKRSPLTERERKKYYQTVFAKRQGSAAAPTASLHFTPRLLSGLKRQGIGLEFVTLHVGLGTFAPLTAENFRTNRLHHEHYEISRSTAKRLNRYQRQGRPIIAVGTTVARTLESAARRSRLTKLSGETSLFIQPGYRWKFVDGLITNFHVPKSSLLMLVASLVGRKKLFELYQIAILAKFKFFSFGDGMLIV